MRKALDSNPRPQKYKTNNTGEERRYSKESRGEEGKGGEGERRTRKEEEGLEKKTSWHDAK